jgi:hypothetical protein
VLSTSLGCTHSEDHQVPPFFIPQHRLAGFNYSYPHHLLTFPLDNHQLLRSETGLSAPRISIDYSKAAPEIPPYSLVHTSGVFIDIYPVN